MKEIFRFELAYQLGRPWTWLIFTALAVFAFLFVRVNFIADALYADIHVNTPFLISGATVMGGLIWLLMGAAIAGEAAARDVQTRMYPLTYTTSVSKAEYLGGRFLAALLLNALLLLAVQAGILLGYYAPGAETALLGPFRSAAYLTAYAYIALPNAIVATAIQFSLALRSGRSMAGYFGSFLLFFMGFFIASALLWHQSLGTLLDPIGIRFIVEDLAHLWTTIEQSTRLIGLEGKVLTNRLLWLGIALVVLATTFLSFCFAHHAENSWWSRIMRGREMHTKAPAGFGLKANMPLSIPKVPLNVGFAMHAYKTGAIAWDAFRSTATSWPGLAFLVFIPLLTILVLLDQISPGDISLVPTTMRVIKELTAPLADELSRWVIIPLLLVFFAGQLVWRERDARVGELTDAMPGSEWSILLGKFLGLSFVLVLFTALQIGGGILSQVILGYQEFEVGLYLKILFGFQLTEYLLFALLAFVVHVFVDQKYIGHLVAIIAYVFIALSSMFGVEHSLLIYSAGPNWSYTEMQGFGQTIYPWLWFKGYWAAWALLLAVVARLFWVRGREKGFSARLQGARRRFTKSTAVTAALALGLILCLGGYIFYNTNVLHEYLSASELKERKAEYERLYGQYANILQPKPTATKLQIDIYPERQAVAIQGVYQLVNRSNLAIDSIHVAIAPGKVATQEISLNKAAILAVNDQKLGYQIYRLERPLQPGDSMQLEFQVQVEQKGFSIHGDNTSLAENGTNFTNSRLPSIGYLQSRELIMASDRREYGLQSRPIIASLYDPEARKARGPGIHFEAVVSTHEDQVAVAPGALRRSWTEGGRRYFHYVTDGPIGGEWAFFSADYTILEAQWHSPENSGQIVDIRIFHDPRHTAQLERMLSSIRASLDYYSKHFGPYPYSHLSVVERPGGGIGMHAEASMLTFSEGFSLYNLEDYSQSFDHLYAVVAHEMAHQWTVPYANVEGAPIMSESIAWYYAMKAVEKARGAKQFQQLLKFLRQSHVRREIRRGEPLLRGLDPYMSYRKGPFALYTLSEYIGDETVNRALRRLVEKHEPIGAPLATTLDLYAELQAVTPDSMQYLLHDLFEVNTYWEVETKQVAAVQAENGNWEVKLEVQASKVVVDSAGVEKEVPMNDWVEIALLEQYKEVSDPFYLQKHRIRSGKQTIKLVVPHKPVQVILDPRHLLSELERDDDEEDVEIKNQKVQE